MSVGLQIRLQGISALEGVLSSLAAPDVPAFLDVMGALLESQTRARISEDKKSPDGRAWPEWSDAYAETRHGGHSLLENDGHLIGSIHYIVEGDTVWVGSELIYAATHQFGSRDETVPARAFLGLSAANEADLLEEAILFFKDRTEGPAQ